MSSTPEIVFKVNESYENEKGVFTVLAIEGAEMAIRWESGEEIRTPIDLQYRIQNRRQWEAARREALAEKEAKKAAVSSRRRKLDFTGLLDTDFKNTAAGTSWRGRTQLGGAVAQNLDKTGLKINSWAFVQKPEAHWQATAHHRDATANQAWLFVRLDPEQLTCGFHVVASTAGKGEEPLCWNRLNAWLTDAENGTQTRARLAELALSVTIDAGDEIFLTPGADSWQIETASGRQAIDGLAGYLETLEGAAGLTVFRTIPKATALAQKEVLAEDIGVVFNTLLPLYRACLPDNL